MKPEKPHRIVAELERIIAEYERRLAIAETEITILLTIIEGLRATPATPIVPVKPKSDMMLYGEGDS
jgi:hypothetical protein